MSNKEVVGYVLSTDTTLVSQMGSSDYTTVILSFVISDGDGTLSPSTELQAIFDDPSVISGLKTAGKRVLISLGGANFSGSAWAALANDVDSTAAQLADMVSTYDLDGVDIDWEDTNFSGYEPVDFLVSLSETLKEKLPTGQNFITHAPQAPYFYGGDSQSYSSIYVDVAAQAGDNIDLYNIQYYNNSWYVGDTAEEETSYVAGTTEVSGTTFPSSIVGIVATGVDASKLLVGKPTTSENADSGYISADDIVTYLIDPLQSAQVDFAGVMGWQYATQTGSTEGTDDWASTLAKALGN